jgi:hypothetical protein
LHDKFFKELEREDFEVKELAADEFEKFLFFFNKRVYKSLKMENVNVIFPRVFYQLTNSLICNTFQNIHQKVQRLKDF